MADKRSEFLNKMLGMENAAELLDKGIDTLVGELKKRGVEHKSTDEQPTEGENVYATLLSDMIKAQADMDTRLEETQAAVNAAEAQKSADQATIKTLTDTVKEMTERLTMLETASKSAPRIASRAQETEIEPNQMTEELRKHLEKRDPVFGLPIKE